MKPTSERYVKTWTLGLSPIEKDVMFSQLELAEGAFSKLASILDQKIDASVKNSRKESSYNTPNWALEQADAIGYQRALANVLTLINQL